MDNQKIDMYKSENKIYLAVTNIQKFRKLITDANEEAHQLSKTINELNNFSLEIELNVKE